MILAEEEQSNSNDLSDDYDFNQLGNDLDTGLHMDWDSDDNNWDPDEQEDLVLSACD
jgi:hypothetical protein